MLPGRRGILWCWIFLVPLAAEGRAEEAVDRMGRRVPGTLVCEQDGWLFRTTAAKDIPVQQLAYVRFRPEKLPLPETPLTHTLHLPQEQHITGSLLRVDEKTV